MPRTRYEREQDRYAGPKFRRAYLIAFLAAALIGVVIGAIWVISGLWHFHGPR